MGWVRVSDDFYDHPKMADLSPMAVGLWVTGLAWCNRNLSDGHLPERVVGRLLEFDGVALHGLDVSAGETATELVCAGLWETDERGGFQVVDYLDYQPSSERVKAERARNARRQQEWRERNAVTNGGVTVAPTPTPTPKQKTSAAAAAENDPAFAEFWSNYPRKAGKAAAVKAYAKAVKATGDAQVILDGLAASLRYWDTERTEARFIPHPSTWLNQGRWADETATPATKTAPEKSRALAQCDDSTPHGRHTWEDPRNIYLCQGV